MKKFLMMVAIAAGAAVASSATPAQAGHDYCAPGYSYGGGYGSGYSYVPTGGYTYVAPSTYYRAPRGYGSNYYYGRPAAGFRYSSPGFSINIGSGYRSRGGYYGNSRGYSGFRGSRGYGGFGIFGGSQGRGHQGHAHQGNSRQGGGRQGNGRQGGGGRGGHGRR